MASFLQGGGISWGEEIFWKGFLEIHLQFSFYLFFFLFGCTGWVAAKAATQPGRRLSLLQLQSRMPQPLCLQRFLNTSCWLDSKSAKPLENHLFQRIFVQNMANACKKMFSHIDIENGLVFQCCFLTERSFYIFLKLWAFLRIFQQGSKFLNEKFSILVMKSGVKTHPQSVRTSLLISEFRTWMRGSSFWNSWVKLMNSSAEARTNSSWAFIVALLI